VADSRATDILRIHGQFETDRKEWERSWDEVAERCLPRRRGFQNLRDEQPYREGENKSEKIFDSTALLALERFAAAMESMLTPRTQQWHKLAPMQAELKEDQEVQEYLDEVTRLLFAVRYSPRANFASQANEVYMDLGAFGTGGMYIEDDVGRGIRYASVPLEQLFFSTSQYGDIDMVHRDFQLTARQAMQRWGDKCPQAVKTAYENKPMTRFRFIHCVKPQEEYDSDRKDRRGMPWASVWVCHHDSSILAEGGYRTMPYAISRYVTSTKETYGRGPAMTVLPTIKTANEMKKTILRAGQKAVDPPLLLTEDGLLRAFDLRSGALNYGGLDAQGNEVVKPFNSGSRVDIGADMLMAEQRTINDAFLVTLFQILVEAPTMTATEAMLRAQEKGALLAPTMGRQQSEFLGPLIQREIDILSHAGVLPEMPDALVQAGGAINIEYESPIVRAQKAEEGVAIIRTLESLTPLAQIDPSVLMVFDAQKTARALAEINGFPAKAMRSEEEVEAIKEEQANAAQAQQLLAAAPVMSGVAKDMAQAQSLAGANPAQAAPDIFGGAM
jgi:L-rhamnose mutarotase